MSRLKTMPLDQAERHVDHREFAASGFQLGGSHELHLNVGRELTLNYSVLVGLSVGRTRTTRCQGSAGQGHHVCTEKIASFHARFARAK